jgi:hypothetical protein
MKSLLTPAVGGGAAITVAAMKALLSESLVTMMLTAQARLLVPAGPQNAYNRSAAPETQVMALARSAADAALAIARLPAQTPDGLVPAEPRRGQLPRAAEPRLVALVEGVVTAHAGAAEPESDVRERFGDRLAQIAARMRAEGFPVPPDEPDDEQTRESDVRMEAAAVTRPLGLTRR